MEDLTTKIEDQRLAAQIQARELERARRSKGKASTSTSAPDTSEEMEALRKELAKEKEQRVALAYESALMRVQSEWPTSSTVKNLNCKSSCNLVGPTVDEDIEADDICTIIEENEELKRQVQSLEDQIEDQTQVINENERLRARNLELLSKIAQLTQQRQTGPSQDAQAPSSPNAQNVDSDEDEEDDKEEDVEDHQD